MTAMREALMFRLDVDPALLWETEERRQSREVLRESLRWLPGIATGALAATVVGFPHPARVIAERGPDGWLLRGDADRLLSLDADIQSLMVMEHLAVGVMLNSEDAAEGVSAFLEKREPQWKGR